MSTYIINSEPENSSPADADEMLVFDAGTGVTEKVGLDTLRQYMASSAVSAASASLAVTAALHAGAIVILNRAAGVAVTLPAATGTGNTYTFIVGVAVTSNTSVIQVANATDEFSGVVFQSDTDTGDALVPYTAIDADGYDTITMDGTTTGGLIGDKFVITDVAAGKFALHGYENANGTVATPLSAAVSS